MMNSDADADVHGSIQLGLFGCHLMDRLNVFHAPPISSEHSYSYGYQLATVVLSSVTLASGGLEIRNPPHQ